MNHTALTDVTKPNASELQGWQVFRLARRLAVTGVLLVACVPLANVADPPAGGGPLGTVPSEVTVGRPDGSTFQALVVQPTEDTKEGSAQGRIAYPLPAIAFGHAYFTPVDRYAATLEALASRGYLMIAPRSGGELFPDHARFAEDLSHCLTFLAEQTDLPQSPWYGQVKTDAFGVLGHSMGGGAAVLAAASDNRVKAVATLAAAETRPSAVEAARRLTAPYLGLLGTEDEITPPAEHALPIYEAVASPRVLLLIDGGFHCGFLDSPTIFCDEGSVSREAQLALSWERVSAFFDVQLRDLPDANERLTAPAPAGTPGLEVRTGTTLPAP